MKLWLKYLIGIGVGLVLALILPPSSVQSQATLDFIVDLVIRVGRYTLVPVLFFSVAVSAFKLRDEKQLYRTTAWTLGVIVASSLGLMLLGLIAALMIKLPRIPITTEKISEVVPFTWRTLVTRIFPHSGFEALIDGVYLFPCFVFAFLAGAGSASDLNASKSAVSLFDSLSKVFYIVMSFFTEILAVGMIAVMFRWTLDFIATVKTGVFNSLILMLFVLLLLVAFVIYPVILRFFCHELHPYKVLYAGVCPFITAFFSGDTNLALALHLRHGKESLGIKRRVNAFAFPLFSILGRGGAALVQTISFVLILRSYSSLGIPVTDVFWIGGISFLLSFALAGIPCGGPFIAVTAMCLIYGRNFDSGYLLLKNAAPVICAFAAGIDALTAIFGSYIVAVKTKTVHHQELRKYI
ncbi:dicarboxylate/amino acid:cation symporter [Treponema sp.]|uniref:dicarboxylate/amino acid:cation symporter n=1 Tax=Treponema sp. TaxID=166 RepID=UPI00298E50A5|nr:cation:dicarboxylase symporter family transporter [Treponema sp.]MCI6442610.1 cation:dicarboxylase symporter family transporter [Spirochaetia bacterium]MDY4133399.1 cation:dicarboxylase symporter family transporter [Treponema sp.]